MYDNIVTVQLTGDPAIKTRMTTVYAKTVKIYRGIDNLIKFKVLNQDQKPVNLAGLTLTFTILDDVSGALWYQTTATTTDTPYIPAIPAGPLGVPAEVPAVPAVTTGIAVVVIGDYSLLDLDNIRYNYSLKATDTLTGVERVIYSDDNYTARGELEVLSGNYPQFRPSVNVPVPPLPPAPVYTPVYTSAIPTDIAGYDQSINHTAQFYFDSFSGDISVEATLDPVASIINWATVVPSQTYVAQDENTYVNWTGAYSAIRFKITPLDQTLVPSPVNTGLVTKILYRS
jgi:hypothetical protein